MKTFTIVTRPDDRSREITEKIKTQLSIKMKQDDINPELCIAVGGDGTFLYAVHQYRDILEKISFVGVHTGTLGFFTDYSFDEVEECIEDILRNEYKIIESQLLEIAIDQDEKKLYALNEMRVENSTKTQIIDIFINGDKLETYRGTGICICTQIGSTAYNRSVQGAVIQEGLPVIQISEIAGIHHREFQSLRSPLVLKEDSIVTLESDSFNGAFLCTDSDWITLEDKRRVTCRLSDKSVRMSRYRKVSYIERLKNLF